MQGSGCGSVDRTVAFVRGLIQSSTFGIIPTLLRYCTFNRKVEIKKKRPYMSPFSQFQKIRKSQQNAFC